MHEVEDAETDTFNFAELALALHEASEDEVQGFIRDNPDHVAYHVGRQALQVYCGGGQLMASYPLELADE